MEDNQKKTPERWHEKRGKIESKWLTPFLFIEWLAERILYSLRNSALFEILGYSGRFVLVVSFILAAITFFTEKDEREKERENILKQKHYQAWQVINLAQGKGGGGGRLEALRDLAKDNIPLNGIDLSFADISGLDLPEASLVNTKFIEASLDSSNFQNSNISLSNLKKVKLRASLLDGVSFIKSDLTEADLSGSSIRRGNFSSATLINIDLSNTVLDEANFNGADLRDANLEGAILFETKFYESNLQGANLKGLDFSSSGLLVEFEPKVGGYMGLEQFQDSPWKVLLEDASLQRANLDNLFLVRANLSNTKLLQASFRHANLTNADFENAWLGGADFSRANLSAANLTGAAGSKVIFDSTDLGPGPAMVRVYRYYEWGLEPANLTNVHFPAGNFRSANLRGAIMINARLTRSQFEKADLTGADLRNADLSEVNLLHADLKQADLRNTILRGIRNWKSIKDITLTNIYGVKNAPDGFIEWALHNGAVAIQSDGEWAKIKNER